MTPLDLARVFLSKARQDFEALDVLARSDVADEIVGFHAQQAVEKALKAVLTAVDVRVGRTHDIAYLLSLLPADQTLPDSLAEVTSLAPYAVIARYTEPTPDETLDLHRGFPKSIERFLRPALFANGLIERRSRKA